MAEQGGKYVFHDHHIIPRKVWERYKHILKPFLENGAYNLKRLPTPFHGNHPQYNKYVSRRLGEIITGNGGTLSVDDLRSLQKELRHLLRDAYDSGNKLNDYFRQFN